MGYGLGAGGQAVKTSPQSKLNKAGALTASHTSLKSSEYLLSYIYVCIAGWRNDASEVSDDFAVISLFAFGVDYPTCLHIQSP